MTRDERICERYRADQPIRDIARDVGLSREQVGKILAKNGLKARIPGRTLSVLTRYMRKHLIGDLTMTSAQLAESIAGRLLRVGRAYVLIERGKVYAPSKTSPELADIMRAYPKMVVGCYVVGVEAAAIAEDLECVRGGAA